MEELTNFKQQVLQAKNIVILIFTSTWCVSCHAMKEKLLRLTEELTDIILYEADVLQWNSIASEYGVAALPTIMFFCKGHPEQTIIGNTSSNKISRTISNIRMTNY